VGAERLKPPSRISVREYDERRDGEALRACVIELQEFERQFAPEIPEGRAMVDAYLNLALARCRQWKGSVFVAEVEGEVVGMSCVWGRVTSEEPDDDPADYAYVSDLVVRSTFRGRGVGRALMRVVEDYARVCGVDVLRVQALARNTGAMGFYERVGFGQFQIEMAKRLT
jgi:ribosomal protein S18 acetylase RimI-like enzyme